MTAYRDRSCTRLILLGGWRGLRRRWRSLGRRARGGQVLLQLGCRYCTRDSAAVGKEQGGGTVDVKGIAQLLQGVDRVAAAGLRRRQFLFVHPLCPGLLALR